MNARDSLQSNCKGSAGQEAETRNRVRLGKGEGSVLAIGDAVHGMRHRPVAIVQ